MFCVNDAAVMADFMAAQNNGKAFTTEEGLNLFRLQRSQEIQNRKKELLVPCTDAVRAATRSIIPRFAARVVDGG